MAKGCRIQVGLRLLEELCRKMPDQLAVERVFSTYQFAIHACANRAKILDHPKAKRVLSSDEAFAINLIDMCVGALKAPVHASLKDD